jgi:putative ABC transport system permease protein
MSRAGIVAALRIARRDAVRAKGRSVLVVAMIGLPMLGLAAADVAVRTAEPPPAEVARREIGAADLVARHVSDEPITQRGRFDYDSKTAPARPRKSGVPRKSAPDLAPLLPPGSRVSERRSYYAVRVRGAGERVTLAAVQQLELADDLSRGMVRLRSGALATAPGDTVLTPSLARTLRVGIGDTVSLVEPARAFRVVGIAVLPTSTDGDAMFVPNAAALPAELGLAADAVEVWSAVALPSGYRDVDLLGPLNEKGFQVNPRTWYAHPPPTPYDSSISVEADAVGMVVVVVGLATLEIVLLAGTAFAVGARRRRRELALVAATGGDRRDVRRIVLAGGVVLGATAGAVGIAGGVAAVFFGRPLLQRFDDALLGPLDVRPLELAAIVAVGIGTALLATLLPARAAARQSIVAALTGRRGELRTPRRGAPLAFWAAGDGRAPASRLADGANRATQSGRPAHFLLLLAGAVMAELGFVACAPTLVGLVGRLGARLPLPLRLAARDAARHRSRSGPAVGAVVAAVAGSIAVSVYLASDTERQRRSYDARYPRGSVWIGQTDTVNAIRDSDVAAAAARLPVRERFTLRQVGRPCVDDCESWHLKAPEQFRCPDQPINPELDVRCSGPGVLDYGSLAVGDPGVAAWAADRPLPAEASRVLAAGGVVVFDARWVVDGHVEVEHVGYDNQNQVPVEKVVARLPAAVVPFDDPNRSVSALLTPAAVRAAHLPTQPWATLVTTTRLPTPGEEAAARGAITKTGRFVDLYVERGFVAHNGLALLALLAASTLVTVGATGIATGLAAADSRPDLATLAAVGAAPRVRRRLAMAQAATVAALGSGLGILAGLVPAVSIVAARAEFPFVVPWVAIATTALGVPLVAALLVGAVTRSRLPLERRIE